MSEAGEEGRILIVDDDPDVLETLGAVLEEFWVDTAANLRDGLHLVRSDDYDVVIVDHRLPDGTGKAILTALRHGLRASGILLTGQTEDAEVRQLQRDGDFLVLFKPFDPADLRRWVQNELSMVRLRRTLSGLESRRAARPDPPS